MTTEVTRDPVSTPPSTRDVLLEIFRDVLGAEVESVDQRLAEDLNLDSVQLLELIARIDDRTGVDLGARLAEGVRLFTVAEVVGEVERHLPDAAGRPPSSTAERRPDAMRPLFFTHDGVRLYGVLHPSATENGTTGAIVLPPFAHEYFQCVRALRHLGLSLARAGVSTLRTDFAGVGDSDLTLWEARLPRWIDGVHAAADELRSRAELERIALVGLRLGATIAAEACAQRPDEYDLVLWNPITDGRAYVDELESLHLRSLGKRSLRTREPGELLGTRIHPELLEAVAAVDWRAQRPPLPSRTFLVRGSDDAAVTACFADLPGLERDLAEESWRWDAFYSSFYWPQSALKSIVRWVGGR